LQLEAEQNVENCRAPCGVVYSVMSRMYHLLELLECTKVGIMEEEYIRLLRVCIMEEVPISIGLNFPLCFCNESVKLLD